MANKKKNRTTKTAAAYLALTAAGMINAFGITFFLYPVNLYDSGISGLSMLLAQVTPSWLPLSAFLVVLNLPLFIFGFKRLGLQFTLRSVYAVIIYSLSAWVITDVLPVDVSFASPLASRDLLLCAIFGGLISGIGSGLTIRFGGAIDGIEILSVMFAKRLGLSVGVFVMCFNVVLYIAAGIIINSWILPLYSIITYAAAVKTVDFIAEGLDKAKSAMIITNHPKEVCDALSGEFGSGITIMSAKGYYSNSDKSLIYFVVNRFQISKVRDIVHENDPAAYVTITDVSDVLSTSKEQKDKCGNSSPAEQATQN